MYTVVEELRAVKHNRMCLVFSVAVIFVAGITIGRFSKIEPQAPATVMAKSTDTTLFNRAGSENGECIPVPIEGTNLTVLDYRVTVPSENNGPQTFSFFMGFTR